MLTGHVRTTAKNKCIMQISHNIKYKKQGDITKYNKQTIINKLCKNQTQDKLDKT